MTVAVAVGVSLELDCGDRCEKLARPVFEQLSSGRYDECAVLPIPGSLDEWRAEHRTARKRIDRCRRLGYSFRPLARERHNAEIHAINVSKPRRQGRPMSEGYQVEPNHGPLPRYECDRHAIRTWGVWSPTGVPVAYVTIYRCGDLVLVSQILGHGDYEDDGIMHLLFAGALEQEIGNPGAVVYNRWDSGTDGLRQFKGWLGFEPVEVAWLS